MFRFGDAGRVIDLDIFSHIDFDVSRMKSLPGWRHDTMTDSADIHWTKCPEAALNSARNFPFNEMHIAKDSAEYQKFSCSVAGGKV